MSVSQVYRSDKRTMAKIKALLEKVDITLDEHLDYTCAVFDEEGAPIATGSAFGSTLRCFAVDPAHQGEGLLNEVITHLMEDRMAKGWFHLFVYTKPGSARFSRTWASARSPRSPACWSSWRTGKTASPASSIAFPPIFDPARPPRSS